MACTTATAWLDSGTTCSLRIFIRSAGMRHSLASIFFTTSITWRVVTLAMGSAPNAGNTSASRDARVRARVTGSQRPA